MLSLTVPLSKNSPWLCSPDGGAGLSGKSSFPWPGQVTTPFPQGCLSRCATPPGLSCCGCILRPSRNVLEKHIQGCWQLVCPGKLKHGLSPCTPDDLWAGERPLLTQQNKCLALCHMSLVKYLHSH